MAVGLVASWHFPMHYKTQTSNTNKVQKVIWGNGSLKKRFDNTTLVKKLTKKVQNFTNSQVLIKIFTNREIYAIVPSVITFRKLSEI
jgi:hypothetical protein